MPTKVPDNKEHYISLTKKGTHQHYKGQFYEAIDIARHSETLENLVVYRALYGEFALWVRPLGMFLGDVEVNNIKAPRFKFIDSQSD